MNSSTIKLQRHMSICHCWCKIRYTHFQLINRRNRHHCTELSYNALKEKRHSTAVSSDLPVLGTCCAVSRRTLARYHVKPAHLSGLPSMHALLVAADRLEDHQLHRCCWSRIKDA